MDYLNPWFYVDSAGLNTVFIFLHNVKFFQYSNRSKIKAEQGGFAVYN